MAEDVRYVRLKDVTYELGNGRRVRFIPLAPVYSYEGEDIISFDWEKYGVKASGEGLASTNISPSTLGQFNLFLLTYREALRRLA